jgi:PAS domain S-box-containing protein
MVFANPSMIEIVGHPMSFLLSQPYTACIHPEDLPTVEARHQRRLHGEPVEPNYGFRVITQTSEVRHLELSAVVIEWNEQAATLLFAVDATARVLAEEDQRVALQKQGELNDLKSRFMSMASHEFRTPLATIQGSTELLRHYDERLNGEQRAQTLEKIDTAVYRMTRMLENVLLIGRADSGKIDFKPQSILFTPFCLALIDELRGSMAYKSATIGMVYDLPPPDQSYWLDDTLLRNMVGNLISNALKYSPQDSEVFFSANADAHTLTIKVQDQGMGIPQADLPALFQRFHRASNVGHIPGTGLGLAIVKDSVAWHRGTIGVDSELGRGSCFTVTLPINAVQTSTTEPGA